MTTRRPHLLVLGGGSVGKRHLKNFAGLGCEVSVMDIRPERVEEAAAAVPVRRRFPSLDSALPHLPEFDGVVVCSPPHVHTAQCLAALQAGRPVLLEKPVSPDLASALALKQGADRSTAPLLLGYTYRWWPPVLEFKNRLSAGRIGRVLNVRFTLSAHLADWHPWERYQDFFMASREQGGGALLDESHFLDLMLWFFGKPARVFASIGRISSLEIETDDHVDALFAYDSGMRVTLHLNLYGRPHERSITATGENGSLRWSYEANSVDGCAKAAAEWERTPFTCERNDMFVGVAREFLDVLDRRREPSCTLDDGIAALRIIEAMRTSSTTGREILLD